MLIFGKNGFTASIAEDGSSYATFFHEEYRYKIADGWAEEYKEEGNSTFSSVTTRLSEILKKQDAESITPEEMAGLLYFSAKGVLLDYQEGTAVFADKMTDSLVMAGLGTIGSASLKTYQDILKQMGDYYLTGVQKLCSQLLIEITNFQKDSDVAHYGNAIDILKRLHTLSKKSRQYIENKLANDDAELDDNMLYEELGGVWKLAELEEIGRGIKDKDFVQLSFWTDYSEAAKMYTDTGCWICLEDGNIYINYNYRPLKAIKYIKQDDSVFGAARVQRAATYPGDGNLRIRWENAQIRDLTEEDYSRITSFASGSINSEAKAIKNTLKNTLAQPMLLKLVKYQKIARCDDGFVLISESGDNILLGDMPDMEQTTPRIEMLPGSYLLKDQVMLAAFYYNNRKRRLQAQPLSIITKNSIVRMLY